MKCWLLLMYGLYLDDVREQVCRLSTQCVSSTKQIKNITVVLGLKCRVVTRFLIQSFFFISFNETDSLSKVWNLSLINLINTSNIKSVPSNQNLKNSGWNPSCGRILYFSTRCSNGNILSLWYRNQVIQKPKFISTYKTKTSMKDSKWDKIILKNRIWPQSVWSKRVS
jgi:hypothetical protein